MTPPNTAGVRETEVKFRVADIHVAKRTATAQGTQFTASITQVDRIHAPSRSSIVSPSPGTVVMRIRKQGNKFILNQKVHQTSELDCVEFESVVSDALQVEAMLSNLGLRYILTVEKVRHPGRYGPYAVVIDEVEGLGSYIEVERTTDLDTTSEDTSTLVETAHQLFSDVLVERIFYGYDRLILGLMPPEQPLA